MSIWPPKPSKPPTAPPTSPSQPNRAIAVIVNDTAGAPIAGAEVALQDSSSTWQRGVTNDQGYLEFRAVPASLTASHLRVEAESYTSFDGHVDLAADVNQQVWLGGTPQQSTAVRLPALASARLVPAHDPAVVRCNFGSLWDPVANRWIFQNMYPSMDAETRARWRQIAADAGDTHFQIGNPTTPVADYHDQSRYVNWLTSGRMAEWNACLAELIADGFTAIVYADSGDAWPGDDYHRRFCESIRPDLRFALDGTPQILVVPGHEIIPGGYTTMQGARAVDQIAAVLGPTGLIGMHTGDGRLSWGSNPLEPDDPWRVQDPDTGEWSSDEPGCWRSATGQKITHHFYQAPLTEDGDALNDQIVGSMADNAHGVITRILGDHWIDGNGYRAPDWFSGLPRRVHGVLWEQDEELLFKGRRTRARLLEIARVLLTYGFTGYGCGSPEMLRKATP